MFNIMNVCNLILTQKKNLCKIEMKKQNMIKRNLCERDIYLSHRFLYLDIGTSKKPLCVRMKERYWSRLIIDPLPYNGLVMPITIDC